MVITPSQRGTHTGTFSFGNATPSTSNLSVFSWWHYDNAGQISRHYSNANALFDQVEFWSHSGEQGIVLTSTKAATYGLRTHRRVVQSTCLNQTVIASFDQFLAVFLSFDNPLLEVATNVQTHMFLKDALGQTEVVGIPQALHVDVLRTEINEVIKPQALTRSQYRAKRQKKIGIAELQYRWSVYEKYQLLLRTAGYHDRGDLVALARKKIDREAPKQCQYDHLVVCEPHLWNAYEINILKHFLR